MYGMGRGGANESVRGLQRAARLGSAIGHAVRVPRRFGGGPPDGREERLGGGANGVSV